MNRRQALIAAGTLAAAPLLRAQAPQLRRVGVLVLSAGNVGIVPLFSKRMAELGWTAGKNLAIEIRHADSRLERLPELVAELVRLNVEVIVTASTPVTRAAKDGNATIPVVFTWVADPVGAGLVASLARPGGNLTGLSNQSFEIGPKQIELLKELIPNLRRVAELSDPEYDKIASGTAQSPLKRAAAGAKISLVPVVARSAAEIEGAFAAAARERAAAMVVPPMPLYGEQRRHIAELALKYRIPTASQARSFVEAGGLVSYGSHLSDGFIRTAVYVDKILRGAKPADLPVERMDRFETAINLQTAKALGIKVPPSVMMRATEIIE